MATRREKMGLISREIEEKRKEIDPYMDHIQEQLAHINDISEIIYKMRDESTMLLEEVQYQARGKKKKGKKNG